MDRFIRELVRLLQEKGRSPIEECGEKTALFWGFEAIFELVLEFFARLFAEFVDGFLVELFERCSGLIQL